MIRYDAHSWGALFRVRGSVIPQAALYAGVVSLLAAALKFQVNRDFLQVNSVTEKLDGSSFSGFTMVLSLILVFRTNQAYTRFWASSAHVCDFTAELQEAVSAVAAFTTVSTASPDENQAFLHRMVRLCSLLHATALQMATGIADKEFPVLDIKAIRGSSLTYLKQCKGEERVTAICQWIQVLIVQGMTSGVLNVPPPILSRVFQALEKSKCSFHQFHQIVKIPFPYPYAQATWILLAIYCIYTPCVMMWWTESPIMAFISTFLCTIGMFVVEITAGQLEDPFGDDANDLPVLEFQFDMNKFLLTLLDTCSRDVPKLRDDAVTDPAELFVTIQQECTAWHGLSQTPDSYSHDMLLAANGRTRNKRLRPSASNLATLEPAGHWEPEDLEEDVCVRSKDLEPDLDANVDSSPRLQELKRDSTRLDMEVSSFFPIEAQNSSMDRKDDGMISEPRFAQLLQEQSRIHSEFLLQLTQVLQTIQVRHVVADHPCTAPHSLAPRILNM